MSWLKSRLIEGCPCTCTYNSLSRLLMSVKLYQHPCWICISWVCFQSYVKYKYLKYLFIYIKYYSFHIFSGFNITSLLLLSLIMEIRNLELYSHLFQSPWTSWNPDKPQSCLFPPTCDLNIYLTFQSCVLCWCMKKLHYTSAKKKSWLWTHLLFPEINQINKPYEQCICIYIFWPR